MLEKVKVSILTKSYQWFYTFVHLRPPLESDFLSQVTNDDQPSIHQTFLSQSSIWLEPFASGDSDYFLEAKGDGFIGAPLTRDLISMFSVCTT